MNFNNTIKEKMKMLLKKNKIIGYAQLYFKIVGEKETYYAAFDGEFRKPLSWLRLYNLRQSMKRGYEKFDKIYSVEFCSEEEWEENRSDCELSCSWGEGIKTEVIE